MSREVKKRRRNDKTHSMEGSAERRLVWGLGIGRAEKPGGSGGETLFGAYPERILDDFDDFCGFFDFSRKNALEGTGFTASLGQGRSAGVLGGAVCLTGRRRNRVKGEKEGRHCEKGRARARSTL